MDFPILFYIIYVIGDYMLRLELITKDNFEFAVKIQNIIFPHYNGRNNYLSSLDINSKNKFFLAYNDDICIGTTGIYYYKNDNDNAWLGFFGLLEEYRYRNYGKLLLKLTEDYAYRLGFKYMRLFTDRLNNDIAINFYKREGYTFEKYESNEEELKDLFDVVIGSKSLIGNDVPKWNNKFINLTKQTKKQEY